jgi:hypothetical protein
MSVFIRDNEFTLMAEFHPRGAAATAPANLNFKPGFSKQALGFVYLFGFHVLIPFQSDAASLSIRRASIFYLLGET